MYGVYVKLLILNCLITRLVLFYRQFFVFFVFLVFLVFSYIVRCVKCDVVRVACYICISNRKRRYLRK